MTKDYTKDTYISVNTEPISKGLYRLFIRHQPPAQFVHQLFKAKHSLFYWVMSKKQKTFSYLGQILFAHGYFNIEVW